MAATFASTILGFAREVINARYYGTRWEMDTFLAAATVPTIVFGLFNGALLNALIPAFSQYLRNDDREGWRLVNTVFNGLVVLLVITATLGWFLAPWYVPLIAHGFPAPQMGVAIRMTRWLMPSVIATSLAGVVAAVLNTRGRFGVSALQGFAINVVTIALVFALDAKLGIYALVLGTALGLGAQLAIQLPTFFALRRYRFEVDLSHPGLKLIAGTLGPIVIGSAAGQIALFCDRFFASTLQPGYISSINYASKLVGFPQQIFAAAIATVIFPLLASHFARENRSALRRSVVMGLRLVAFITIPAACGLIILAGPIVQTLFERGDFTPEATVTCVLLLPYAALALIPMSANIILTRTCFACNEIRWPVAISIVTVTVNVLLSMLWLPSLGARGLLLANGVSQAVQTLALVALCWKLLGGMPLRSLGLSLARTIACSIAMLGTLTWIASLGVAPATTFMGRVWWLAGELVIGGVTFIAAAFVLRADEMQMAVHGLIMKFTTRVPSVPENREVPIA